MTTALVLYLGDPSTLRALGTGMFSQRFDVFGYQDGFQRNRSLDPSFGTVLGLFSRGATWSANREWPGLPRVLDSPLSTPRT